MPRRLSCLPSLRFLVRAVPLSLLLAVPLPAAAQNGYTGAFLAAREAGFNNDFESAIPYLERMLTQDAESAHLLESLTVSYLALGRFDEAVEKAERLRLVMPENYAAALTLLADAFARQDYARVFSLAEAGARSHPLVDGLALAWAHLGQGRMTEALAALDAVAAQEGMNAFAQYCRALALALVGDVEGAADVIEDENSDVFGAISRRGILAYAQVLGQLERFDDALVLLDDTLGTDSDPEAQRLRAAFSEGRTLPFDLISDPAQGMAEVFTVMGSAMRSGQNAADALLYARAAEWINPTLSEALLLTAQMFEDLEQPDAAAEAYGRIPEGDVFGLAAAVGRAQVLETQGDTEGAIAAVEQLAGQNPESIAAWQILGDFQRRAGNHAEAITAYDRAFAMMEARGLEPDWRAYFSRAISFERTDHWPEAEADFRAALAIEPDQPTVLNYLGYSLVERQENLEEALELIERAVAGEPDSGYIVDSLAWALYRMGRYDEAVPHMERAVELLPTDPVLNDHLGDVYWAVGRQREAQFQWRRALSYGPHDDLDMERVRRKIDLGLDEVRREEGAEPLHPER